jgi:ribosomal protein S18 acetylase RimI-like enzyme
MPIRTVAMQELRAERLALRPATEADQPAIVDICKTSITTTYGAFMHPERMRPWVDGQEVEHYVARMWPRMTVAVDAEQLLGVVALDGHVIDLLWIRADLRGRGIGSVLMDQAESTLATDHDVAELECFAPNRASIAFYEARGYTTVRTYYEAASGVDRVVMTKPLSS